MCASFEPFQCCTAAQHSISTAKPESTNNNFKGFVPPPRACSPIRRTLSVLQSRFVDKLRIIRCSPRRVGFVWTVVHGTQRCTGGNGSTSPSAPSSVSPSVDRSCRRSAGRPVGRSVGRAVGWSVDHPHLSSSIAHRFQAPHTYTSTRHCTYMRVLEKKNETFSYMYSRCSGPHPQPGFLTHPAPPHPP